MEKQTITIGLPRALLYYRYYALWRTFFQELDIKVAVSTPTAGISWTGVQPWPSTRPACR